MDYGELQTSCAAAWSTGSGRPGASETTVKEQWQAAGRRLVDFLEMRAKLSPLLCVRQPRKEHKERISNINLGKSLFKEAGIGLDWFAKQLMPHGIFDHRGGIQLAISGA